jgi:hypothetical protein
VILLRRNLSKPYDVLFKWLLHNSTARVLTVLWAGNFPGNSFATASVGVAKLNTPRVEQEK